MMINHYGILLKKLKAPQNGPCITVTLPLFTEKSKTIDNQAYFKNELQKAVYRLKSEKDTADETVIEKLNNLSNKILPYTGALGIGIFISPEFEEIVEFSFHVTEKVIIDQSFEIRDLLYEVNQHISYFLILISSTHIKLYEGKGKKLRPVENGIFPMKYEETHDFPPTPNKFGEGVEDSTLHKKRLGSFYKKAGTKLEELLKVKHIPAILAGLSENLSLFTKSYKLSRILLEIKGDLFNLSKDELKDVVWSEIEQYMHREKEFYISQLQNNPLIFTDLQDIWQNLLRGNGKVLLVEKDFKLPAKIKDNLLNLSMDGGFKTFEIEVEDVIDDMIERMINIKGKVVFVENDRIEKYGHIALIPRFT